MKLRSMDNFDELDSAFQDSEFDELDDFVEYILDCFLEEEEYLEEGYVEENYDFEDNE